ncbi:DUF692 domain-containing protein [Idiomarina sp. HP20-50]|uniref:HvfB family MNIO-type RiPP peptide maturase n=1 Tax=Idiomarina sp. HP20-50 TaxID=3070813 RepID=UPI00294A9A83|nr:DUF692 domain-containing protein [Idiomarina sp. HP20-50]MDV6317156.1 DUF692 domain-containing protein [Idiomarina sp. HP20-50]
MRANSAGLGLRNELVDAALAGDINADFLELAPENWIPFKGKRLETLAKIAENYPLTTHGLSLSIGSQDPLDIVFLNDLKQFLAEFKVDIYSEHLSYCSHNGQLYDLLPIPFTQEAVSYVSSRILDVQTHLNRPLILENVSYYASPAPELTELEFIKRTLEAGDCNLLLDVNNVFVNSVNHGYDPYQFIEDLPSERIIYGHIAGHHEEYDDLFIDTHGAKVKDKVFELLDYAYLHHGVYPTLLERDFNFPSLAELNQELEQIKAIQARYE